ncbi:FAD-dependent monooxygenase [Variovorax sp. LT1R16]|uniref:FAD-dependent monooxygenase n=1 Tax=Variovorax sp. LT1R16 TaxID=3443728 RepID=UPI003F46CE08
MAKKLRILVVGGGIGGMALAIGAAHNGMEVRVIEAGHRLDQHGTGINLMGNALKALDSLGLADACLENGYGWDTVRNKNARGELLNQLDSPRFFRPDAPSALGIMRPRLAEILEANALAHGVKIEHRTRVSGMIQDDDGVTVSLDNGETDRCDLLVAADGVYSTTREMVFGTQHRPTYVGQGSWRYTARRSAEVEGLNLYHDDRGHAVGALPLSLELCYFFFVENSETRPCVPTAEIQAMFRQRLEGFDAPEIRDAVAALNADSYISFRPFDVLLMPQPWYHGRVVLLGDAAHSVTPHLTSGGGMAVEDAVVLGQELAHSPDDVPRALAAYCERRGPRVKKVYETTLAISQIEQDPLGSGGAAMALMHEGYAFLAQPF